MGNPNENNGRVSNSVVSDFCLSLKKKNADEIRNIEDEFYIKACNFSQDEKNSIFNNSYIFFKSSLLIISMISMFAFIP